MTESTGRLGTRGMACARFLSLTVLSLCLTAALRAQELPPGASCPSGPRPPELTEMDLGGRVLDPTGRRGAQGVWVVIENEITGQTMERITNAVGLYVVTDVAPGCYRISIQARPFKPMQVRVIVPADVKTLSDPAHVIVFPSGVMYMTHADITLRLGSEERLTVTKEASLLASEGSVGAVFSLRDIEALPQTNGRTLQSFLNLIPGIVVTDSVGTLAQFTAAGQRRYANRLTIDGVGADLAVDVIGPGIGQAGSGALPALATSGGTQTLVPLAAIEEIQVRTTNASPEHARTPGAQTSIVTRAGSDRFSGSAFTDLRPHQLAANDWFANAGQAPPREIHLWNSGVSLGGPLLSKRLFYFVAWEGQQVDRPVTTTIQVPSMMSREGASPIARALLDAFPRPNGPENATSGLADYTNKFPTSSRLSTISVRLDANLSDRHHLFARFNRGDSSGDAVSSPQVQLPALWFMDSESAATSTATFGLTSILSSTTNDFRLNVSQNRGSLYSSAASYGSAAALPLDLLAGAGASAADAAVGINVLQSAGGIILSGPGGTVTQDQLQITDTWSLARGHHDVRIGFDLRRVDATSDPPATTYLYRFRGLSDLLAERARQVSVVYGTPARALLQSGALFAQDTFHVTPRLSLNYGLRYSIKPAPSSLTSAQPLLFQYDTLSRQTPAPSTDSSLWKTAWTDLAPRIAATYRLRDVAGLETTLHGGWSLAFDELTSPGASAFGRAYPYAASRFLGLSGLPMSASFFAASAPASFESADFAEAYAFPRNLKVPRTYNWQVGVSQPLANEQTLGVAYVGAAGRNLIYWQAYYLGDQAHTVHAFSNDARSDYHSLLIEYVKRLSHDWQARAAYTWSHAIDNDSGEPIGPHPPASLISPLLDRGSADFDRRHVLHVAASYRPRVPPRMPGHLRPFVADWQVDVVGTVNSGVPVTIQESRVLSGAFYWLRRDPVPGAPLWLPDALSPTGERIDAAAFQAPTDARQGTLGRNTIRGSALRQIDLGLSRSVPLGRRLVARLRVDAFNVFNTPNFGPPDGSITDPAFGRPYQSYADALGTGTLSHGGLVPVQQFGGPRSIQLSVRFNF
jgi:hypothetical protein